MRFAPIYIYAGRFPFQATASIIVRTLAALGWDVPGIQVEFCEPRQQTRYVNHVRGRDWMIEFYPDGLVGRIIIPCRELNFWRDSPSLDLNIYTGTNWSDDVEAFMADPYKSGLCEDYPFRQYTDECACRYTGGATFMGLEHTHPSRISPLMLPEMAEPRLDAEQPDIFHTTDVVEQFDDWLRRNVLTPVLQQTPRWLHYTGPKPTNAPEGIMLYTFVGRADAERIGDGEWYGPSYGFVPREWVGDCGNGYASVFAARAHLMSLGIVSDDTSLDELASKWAPHLDAYDYLVRIRPNRSDGIYVIDQRAPDPARTIVPLAGYPGGYAQPMALVARPLDGSEIKQVSGPRTAPVVTQPHRRRWRFRRPSMV